MSTVVDPVIDAFSSKKRVLVAPLNWGLGHAARCIPLIQALENLGVEVFIASDGVALHLLKAEFPHLPALHLPSYRIQYASQNMVRNIAKQLPRILYAIRAEHRYIEQIIEAHHIHGIISDNRYGCFSKQVKCILLTHQLNLRVPNKPLKWIAHRALRLALSQFDDIWVPDSADAPTLSGELSHPANGIKKVSYIGLITRSHQPIAPVTLEYDVAVILSGPEPQRSYLEQLLLEQALSLPYKFIFILGKTKSKDHHYAADHIEVVSYLTSIELNNVIAASGTVICRSGYSSLMDLAAMGKRAILIPTPGQTEQEYLADYLSNQGHFVVQHQDRIDLPSALMAVEQTSGLSGHPMAINQFVPGLKTWLQNLLPPNAPDIEPIN